ncbi:unnamed protein product [Closterium sp. NIES-54]
MFQTRENTTVDDLQLFLQCDRADGLSLFDLTSGASPAPPATADSTVRSQWATCDAAAHLVVHRHLLTTERAHFSQHKSAQTLYDTVVARYSSPATAALSRLFLPYLFPDLAAFPTVADLITHLRNSDTRYHAALPAEFCAKNPPPPMYLTLYYIVTRLPDSLRSIRDHFLSVCPTSLTVDLLEERLLAAEQSIVAVGASRGDPRTPIFEGCSPSPLLPSVASAATADLGGFETLLSCATLHPTILTVGPRTTPFGSFWVSLLETSPTLRWTGKVGDASAFRVWGSRAFVRDLSADKLSPRATPCVFLGFPHHAPGWQFYHPTSHRVLSSQDVTFDESVPYYHLFPYRTAPLPPPPLFLAPGPPPVDPLPPQGPAPSGVSQVDAVKPVEVAVDSGASPGAEPAGAGSGGAVPGGAESAGAEPVGATSEGAEPGGTESGGAEPGGAEPRVAEPGGAEPGGAGSARVASRGASSRRELLSPQELREWFARHWSRAAGAGGTTAAAGSGGARPGGAGAAGPSGAAEAAGVGLAGGSTGASGGTGVAGSTGTRAAGATGAGAAGSVLELVLLELEVLLALILGLPPSTGPAPPFESPQPVQSQSLLQPVSPLPAPSPYTGPTGGLGERRAPASRPASPIRTARTSRRAPRPRPPAVPGTRQMGMRPSTAPLRVPLPSPPESSLPVLVDPESDSLRAASPTFARLLAAVITDPSLESTATSALVADLVDFAARCRLDYVASLEEFQCFAAALPHLVSMLIAPEGDPDAPDIPTPRSYAEAIEGPYSSQWQSAMDVEMASWKSTGTYVDEAPPPGANIVSGMWIFRVKRPPGSPPFFKWHDTLRTTFAALGFAPSTADPSFFLRTDTSLPQFYIFVYVDDLVFATADTAGLAHVKSKLQKRHTCTDLDELRSYLGLQITRDRAQRTITLTQSHMVQQVLQRFDFTYSSPQATPLSTRHLLSALPSDESVEPSGPYPELVGCLMYLLTCTRPDLAYPLSILARYVAPGRHRPEHMAAAKRVLRYLCSTSAMGLVLGGRRPVVLTGHADASWADDQATQRSSQGYSFSLGSGSVSWRSTHSSSVLSSSCEAEIYAGAMAAEELHWLTYLLTDLGEPPRSPPVLYVDNKAMLALCWEHRLEHRTKHIALRYFLARELQQRGQLRLAYVASEANTADIFTKALPPGDHQRFCTMLGLVPTWPHLLTS